MTTLSTTGLCVFVAFVLTSLVVLVVDAVRATTGQVTVTEWAVREPVRMSLLVAAPAGRSGLPTGRQPDGAGACGLAVHLYFFEPNFSR